MIVSAAIKYFLYPHDDTGREIILPLHRHADGEYILKILGFESNDIKLLEQGFLTDKGVFLDRRAALDEAIRSGQISADDPHGYDVILSGNLMSEDLW